MEKNYFTYYSDTYPGNFDDDYHSLGDNSGTDNFLTNSGYVIPYTFCRAEDANGPE